MSIKSLLLAVVVLSASAFTTVPVETYKASVQKSSITWKGYKVTGQHAGTVNLESGDLEFSGDKLTGGSFVMDMTSITVTDLTGEYKGKLEGHLKSKDFFGIENHPTATFKITRVIPKGTPGDYKIIGDMTIKNITKEIKFFANIKDNNGQKVATADLVIDRSDYDVRYGSGSFFDNLGDKTIYDEFDLSIEMVVAK
jgi:polyisoprenoid-binding protein YceI